MEASGNAAQRRVVDGGAGPYGTGARPVADRPAEPAAVGGAGPGRRGHPGPAAAALAGGPVRAAVAVSTRVASPRPRRGSGAWCRSASPGFRSHRWRRWVRRPRSRPCRRTTSSRPCGAPRCSATRPTRSPSRRPTDGATPSGSTWSPVTRCCAASASGPDTNSTSASSPPCRRPATADRAGPRPTCSSTTSDCGSGSSRGSCRRSTPGSP